MWCEIVLVSSSCVTENHFAAAVCWPRPVCFGVGQAEVFSHYCSLWCSLSWSQFTERLLRRGTAAHASILPGLLFLLTHTNMHKHTRLRTQSVRQQGSSPQSKHLFKKDRLRLGKKGSCSTFISDNELAVRHQRPQRPNNGTKRDKLSKTAVFTWKKRLEEHRRTEHKHRRTIEGQPSG